MKPNAARTTIDPKPSAAASGPGCSLHRGATLARGLAPTGEPLVTAAHPSGARRGPSFARVWPSQIGPGNGRVDRPDRARLDGPRRPRLAGGPAPARDRRLPTRSPSGSSAPSGSPRTAATSRCCARPTAPRSPRLLRDHAPALLYEDGMRRCRSTSATVDPTPALRGPERRGHPHEHGAEGRRFHPRDRLPRGHVAGRKPGAAAAPDRGRAISICSTGSTTRAARRPREARRCKGPIRRVTRALGHSSFHPDDWEGYQVRVGPGGTFARATSHHGYNGWQPDGDRYYISGGSHAGRPLARPRGPGFRCASLPLAARTTKDQGIVLIPLETLQDRDRYAFAISPPWRKRV